MAIRRLSGVRGGAVVSVFAVAAAAVGWLACGGAQHGGERVDPRIEGSNIVRGDYAGSASCAPCHRTIYDQWQRSPMHRMTRVATADAIRAPFDGQTFRFGTDSVTARADGAERFMQLDVEGQPETCWRITRVIGGRYREDYAAIQVEHASAGAPVVGDPRAEMIMPVSWIYSTASWRYKGYSVMVHERPGMRAGPEWRTKCIFCHNTTPFLSSTLDALYGPRPPTYQGQLHDNLLPPERAWRFVVTDGDGLRHALEDELARLDGQPVDASAMSQRELVGRTIHATYARFDASALVEVGIGCEACHNGAAEHARGGRLPTYEIRSPFVREEPAHPRMVRVPLGDATTEREPTRAAWINHTCARCHTVLFSRYPYTWEGGSRYAPAPGGSHINSGEARDFLLGGCSTQMSCAPCHDPHTMDTVADLHVFETPAGNTVCTGCHTQLATPAAVQAHAHHAPTGDGGVCVNCHMPRKNMGLDYHLTRYHRIGSPNDPLRVERDRPLECALCHSDKSVTSLVTTMESWWGGHYDRAALTRLYGPDLDVNVMRATLDRGLPHERAVAIGVLGHDRARWALPLLAEQMDDEYPLVRYFALHAVGDITGTLPDWDMNADGTALRGQAMQWLDAEERAAGH